MNYSTVNPTHLRDANTVGSRAAVYEMGFQRDNFNRSTRSGEFLCYFLSSLKESRFHKLKITNQPNRSNKLRHFTDDRLNLFLRRDNPNGIQRLIHVIRADFFQSSNLNLRRVDVSISGAKIFQSLGDGLNCYRIDDDSPAVF